MRTARATAQQWILDYNEDDVRATAALREWLDGPARGLPSIEVSGPGLSRPDLRPRQSCPAGRALDRGARRLAQGADGAMVTGRLALAVEDARVHRGTRLSQNAGVLASSGSGTTNCGLVHVVVE